MHRVGRVLSCFSSRRASVPHPPLVPRRGRGAHLLSAEGVGESQFRRGDTLWYSRYMCTLCFYAFQIAPKLMLKFTNYTNGRALMSTNIPVILRYGAVDGKAGSSQVD
jgi:hypothetical protein